MIVCVCRNIRDTDFINNQDLIDAVMSTENLQCGKCQQYIKEVYNLKGEYGNTQENDG